MRSKREQVDGQHHGTGKRARKYKQNKWLRGWIGMPRGWRLLEVCTLVQHHARKPRRSRAGSSTRGWTYGSEPELERSVSCRDTSRAIRRFASCPSIFAAALSPEAVNPPSPGQT